MELERLKELEKRATAGPWYHDIQIANGRVVAIHIVRHEVPKDAHDVVLMVNPMCDNRMDDLNLILAMRPALPALIEIAEAAKELLNPYPSNGFGGQYAMADNVLDAKKKLKAALAKLEAKSSP